ncbi:hypothetical protein TNCV_2849291 [Trichonephila clavipes]|nr:hypothetical protein TNCV_2849291 [Trichonephila clavipes]
MANVQFLSIQDCWKQHVFLRRDMLRRPLQQPYDGPFKVLQRKDKVFFLTSMVNGYLYLLIDANLPSSLTLRTFNYLKPRMKHLLLWNSSMQQLQHLLLWNLDPTASTPNQPSTRSGRKVHLPTRYR